MHNVLKAARKAKTTHTAEEDVLIKTARRLNLKMR
jgi:hypothetical protein